MLPKHWFRWTVWIAALAGVFLIAGLALAAPATHTSADVFTHPSQGPVQQVQGASASLVTTDEGASFVLHTSELNPGHAYTVWFLAINNPAACATTPCTAADVLFNTAAVQAEITYGAGHVVGESGVGNFAGNVAVGELPGAWFGNGFTNPRGAEIHLVLNDHGPVIADLTANMISTYRGGCTDASLPPPFPATAKADGVPGPNACQLFQFAIFQQ